VTLLRACLAAVAGPGLRPRLRTTAVLLVAGILCACSRIDLYTNLREQEANEVAAVLLAAQIDADKQQSENKLWSVRIDKPDLPRAMDVLDGSGYPHTTTQTMAEVFKKDGFISSPLEERARFISATAQELQHTIARMNGVVDARVHLAMPERDPLTDAVVPASASVFLKYGQNVKFDENGGLVNVKALVRDAVEGLTPERITVVAVPVSGPWRQAIRPSNQLLNEYAYQRPWLSNGAAWLLGSLGVLGLVGFLGWWTQPRWRPWLRRPKRAGKGPLDVRHDARQDLRQDTRSEMRAEAARSTGR
jgi:type III secretion protein J